MSKVDPFTKRRITQCIDDFRSKFGQAPTLKDLGAAGFSEDHIATCLKEKIIEQFYVTLTSGSIVKVFKVSTE